MTMPIFTPGDDPGSSFPELLRRIGADRDTARRPTSATAGSPCPHATTCVALRYADGVVMAGDRRATSGNLISHRAMEKVVQADRFSGVAIAGAAGPAMEMVKLFQLQLEHYEKVEGTALSLEGKANQLSMMVRGNLPAAMQGMVVVPIFAGYDLRRDTGRLWDLRRHRRPLRGARLRRHRLGQPARRHGHQARLPRTASTATTAIDLACRALWEAADADSATGGPDALRGIYPVVATITADGWQRVDDDDLAERFAAHRLRSRGARVDEHAVLRRPRTGDEGPGRLRPQGHRPRPRARRRALRRRHRASSPRTRRNTLRKISEIYDRIAFAGVGKYNEFDQLRVAGVRAADLKGFQYSRDDVDARSLANQYAQILGQIFTHEMKPMEVEILVAEVGLDPDGDQLFHILYDGTVVDERDFTVLGGDAEAITARLSESCADGLDARRRGAGSASAALAGPDRTLAGRRPRGGACSSRPNGRRCFQRLDRRRGRARCLDRRHHDAGTGGT